ncbi:MAG: ribonuclease HII [Erysipelotrichaceae bacterium]|nr:ribonuclease HII [Erysipelotrichaceae bacterium]MDY4640883.1 ribonuclease HII [Erysipelotrichaceae bacterium]
MPLENEYEKIAWNSNELVMGIDEAGRGPLCGPLVVGSCVLPAGYENELINDSKKLSEKKRKQLFDVIKKDALYWNVKIVEPGIIDEMNILEATRSAMQELSGEYKVSKVLTDAVKIPNQLNIPIIKGDAKSISIAAASILAKVTRDNIMEELDKKYPEYEFKKHKGYPTKRHIELMNEYGVFDIYRFSYSPVKNCPKKREN